MLMYHPALDPYHAAFRTLQLLSVEPSREFHRDQLRILDFYLLFPVAIEQIRLPVAARSFRRRFVAASNRYWLSGEPKQVFERIEHVRRVGLTLLLSNRLLDADAFPQARIRLSASGVASVAVQRAQEANTRDGALVQFLVRTLGDLSPFGPGGLKARTGLLDHRYDPQ